MVNCFLSISILAALVLFLSGCGMQTQHPKVCCFQCGDSTHVQSLHCRGTIYDPKEYPGNPPCNLTEMDIKGDDLEKCESALSPYEHVGAGDPNAADKTHAYALGAAQFWEQGNNQDDRAQAWQHVVQNPDLHWHWGNNSFFNASVIVNNHRLALASQGHMLSVRGSVSHPLSPELGGFWEFCDKIVDLLDKAVTSIVDLCMGKIVDLAGCLAAVGFVGVGDDLNKPTVVRAFPSNNFSSQVSVVV